MNEIWYHLGVIRWPLLFSFLAVAVLAITTALRLLRADATPETTEGVKVDAGAGRM